MPNQNIFVSYRRNDSAYIAASIRERLEKAFGAESIYMDVHSMPFGVDFRAQLDAAVGKCDVLLAIIGNDWEGVNDDTHLRRIDDPADFVRIEIESALNRGILVIPVLVDNAMVPAPNSLPESLRDLSFRNAAEVRAGRDLNDHLNRLVSGLQGLLKVEAIGEAEAPTKISPVNPSKKRMPLYVAIAVAALALLGYFMKVSSNETERLATVAPLPMWQTSAGRTQSGLYLDVRHPINWRSIIATPAQSVVTYNAINIIPDAGGLSLTLPDQSGLLVFGLDTASVTTSADAFITRKLKALSRGALAADVAQQLSDGVYQANLRTSGGSSTGVLHVAVSHGANESLMLWHMFLGDAQGNALAIKLAIDSTHVRSN